MFEDSLVESAGRIRTHSKYFAVGSFALQTLLLAALAAYPFLHPATLPKQALTMLLTAPSVPAAPPNLPQRPTIAARPQSILIGNPLTAPIRIPQHVDATPNYGPPPSAMDTGFGKAIPSSESGLFSSLGASPSPLVKPVPPKGPLHISSGVAAGQLLTPIQPIYPPIAKAARVEGTVVVQAVISKEGRIEDLRVISGPLMLQSAAVDAIRTARYRPFTLNGEPVSVATTIHVIFRLGG